MSITATLFRLSSDHQLPWSLAFSRRKPPAFLTLIADLKSTVAPYDRTYDPETHFWHIADGYVDQLQTLMNRYGVELIVVNTDGTTDDTDDGSPMLTDRERALQELFLTPDAPPAVVVAVYRTLAKQYHPDAGGDLEQMQRLNQAMELLR